ncbi:MAG: glutamyl-tRNA reductase [Frankiaceae bacterium]|nr:glutamyl-tRNA reductase [Frankiaceae bacterium]MBV9870220.1 glutamyl-tRNA reductase [Frankiaceae bacterium]
MSLLSIGLSHRSAPVELLEKVVVDDDATAKLLTDLVSAEHVSEALILSTCNRLEVHAEVSKFHGGVQEVSEKLAAHTGVDLDTLTEHLYVHYEDRAVQHLFAVAAGLDSMVVGEQQILGQLRGALNQARSEQTVGRLLGTVADAALRVGKRAHSETGIDRAGRSLVSVGVGLAQSAVGDLSGKSAVVVGAGSMSSLAATELRTRGVGAITIVNRTRPHADRLAAQVGGVALAMAELPDAISAADVLVSCTGAVGTVVPGDLLANRAGRPIFVLDLALPRDVDPAAADLPGVTIADLNSLGTVLEGAAVGADVDAVRRIVTDEVVAYLAKQRADRVAPTVVALRERAQQVVDAELARLLGRLPGADETVTREIRTTVERVVDKLLHAPTVRVKELAEEPGGDSYADALRELFALDPAATEAVARAAVVVEDHDS